MADTRIPSVWADLKSRTADMPRAIGAFEDATCQADSAIVANKRLGHLNVGLSLDQLALGYCAKALEASARNSDDEARTARDSLSAKSPVRKSSATIVRRRPRKAAGALSQFSSGA